jgi:hypothetical protein
MGGGKGGKSVTTGYRYRPAWHSGLGVGPIDAFLAFGGGEKIGWEGELLQSGSIHISAASLWGGDKDQGGAVGELQLMFGEADQVANPYLTATFGSQQPAWRGMATAVWKGGVWGSGNPYPQKPLYKIRKITAGWDGDCWYPEKAVVPGASRVIYDSARIYIAIDVSLSLSPTQFANMKSAMGLVIDALEGIYEASGKLFSLKLVSFAGTSTSIEMEDMDFDALRDWVTALTQRSGTTASAAFGPALDFFYQTEPRKNLLLCLTDGEMTDVDGEVPEAFADLVDNTTAPWSTAAGTGVTIRGIGIGSAFDLGYFDNTGTAIPIITGSDDEAAAQAILDFVLTSVDGKYCNPAHALYYVRTHGEIGREPVENMNDASWTASANTLHTEGFGICPKFDPSVESVDEFEKRICRLIGGSINRSLEDGQIYLDLARGNYDLEDLPVLTDADILDFEEQPSLLDGVVNSISVRYFDPVLRETVVTPPAQAMALCREFGTIHETREYIEVPSATLATRIAERDVHASATPKKTFRLVTTRKPYAWRPNTYFRLQSPKRGIADMVCVLGEKSSGELRSGAIRITATQDIYSLPATSYVEVEPGVGTGPSDVPLKITLQRAFEAPYIDLVGMLDGANLQALTEDAGYLAIVAADPGVTQDYTVLVAPEGDPTYDTVTSHDWCPSAEVVEAAEPVGSHTDFTLVNGRLLSQVTVGTAALWDDEIVRIDAIDADANTVSFGRACADTVPQEHAANARVWFYGDGGAAFDTTAYTDGETLSVKLLDNAGSQQLYPELATPLEMTFDQRQARPYPPADFQLEGAEPDGSALTETITVTWAHRDRLQQADQLVDTTAASVGPESGTSYTLQVIDDSDDSVILEATGLAGPSVDVLLAADYAGGIHIEMWSVRDGLASWQRQVSPSFAYTRGAEGDDYVIANPGSPGTTDGEEAPPPFDDAFAIGVGTDDITAEFRIVPTLEDGLELRVRAADANTGPASFAPNGLGVLDVCKLGGGVLIAGDIFGEGHELTLRYRTDPERWELLNPASAGVDDEIVDGVVDRAPSQNAVFAALAALTAAIDAAVTGLFDFKGDTNASGNPNYPAALKGDAYVISVAGKIGGASGRSVDVGDVYVAKADNAGGTEASVGTSWFVMEHNLVGALLAANNLSDLANTGTALTNLGGTVWGKAIFQIATTASVAFIRLNADGSVTALSDTAMRTALGLGTAALVADSTLAHLAGTEDFTGAKTFSHANGALSTGTGGFKAMAGPMTVDRDGDAAAAQRVMRTDLGSTASEVIYHDGLPAWQCGSNASGNHFITAIDTAGVGRTVLTRNRATGITAYAISPTVPTATVGDSSSKAASTEFVAVATAAVNSNLHGGTSTTGNVGGGEDTLQTYTVPGSTLNTNGQRLRFRAAGSVANNANAKRIRLKFGTTTILDTGSGGLPASAAYDWVIEGEIIRKTATSQVASVTLQTGAAAFTSFVDSTTPAETLANDLALTLTGEATTTNDIVAEVLSVNGTGAVIPATLRSVMLALSPTALWPCDDASTQMTDISGNGHHLDVVAGSPQYQYAPLIPTLPDTAFLRLPISAQFQRAATMLGLTAPLTGDYTIIAFVGTGPNGSARHVFSLAATGETSPTNIQARMTLETDAEIESFWEYSAGSDQFCQSGVSVSEGQLVCIALRKNGTANTVDFFKNGLPVSTIAYANEPSGGASCVPVIGAVECMVGYVGFYNSALTNQQIANIARAGGVF